MAKLKFKQKTKSEKIKTKISSEEVKIFADKIKIVPIDSITLDPRNPRKNSKNVAKLAGILKEHGQRTPITVCKETNIIYKGNTTYKAMRLNKSKFIAVTFQDFENDKKKISYSIADNKSNDWSNWDEDILSSLIKEKFEGVEPKELSILTGFDEKKLIGLQNLNAEDDIEFPSKVKIEREYYAVVLFKSSKELNDFLNKVDPNKEYGKMLPSKLLDYYNSSKAKSKIKLNLRRKK